jgi:hypothetical protein
MGFEGTVVTGDLFIIGRDTLEFVIKEQPDFLDLCVTQKGVSRRIAFIDPDDFPWFEVTQEPRPNGRKVSLGFDLRKFLWGAKMEGFTHTNTMPFFKGISSQMRPWRR